MSNERGTSEPTLARRGLDLLLATYPGFDLLKVDWQLPEDWQLFGASAERGAGPWLLVVLGQRSDDGSEVWARHHFAIWKRTGAVHGVQHDGSVTDDPLFTP